MVSQAFGWPQSELLAIYDYATDKNNSERRVRDNWGYSISQGINSTPSLAVNGVEVQEPPFDSKSMMKLLTDVYNAQGKKLGREPYINEETFLSQ